MTSYRETLTVKKLIKMGFFIIKIYFISSSNDPNITHTKNHICGWSHFNQSLYEEILRVFVALGPPFELGDQGKVSPPVYTFGFCIICFFSFAFSFSFFSSSSSIIFFSSLRCWISISWGKYNFTFDSKCDLQGAKELELLAN